VLLLKLARAVLVLLPCGSSNTVPPFEAPPDVVVPKKLPAASSMTPPCGAMPVPLLKLARALMVPLSCGSSNTVPSFEAPPDVVVPKKLPLLSSSRLPTGTAPKDANGMSEGT